VVAAEELMFAKLILILMAVSTEPDEVGRITATSETVTIERGGRVYHANIGSLLFAGDRLETSVHGGASVFMNEGYSIYLGPETSSSVEGDPGPRTLRVNHGEARAVVGARAGLIVVTASAQAKVTRGILRVSATAQASRIWAEEGSAEVSTKEKTVALGAGSELTVRADGEIEGPTPARSNGWSIRVDELQLAGAAAQSRRLKKQRAKDATDDTVTPFPDRVRQPTTEPGSEESATARAAPEEPTPPDEVPPETTGPASSFQAGASSAVSLALGNISSSSFGEASGGLFADAQQDTLQGMLTHDFENLSAGDPFPGNIFLVTAQSSYTLSNVHLRPKDGFPTMREYWSIGVGSPPTSQVSTDFLTGTNPTPTTLRIPHSDAYLVRLDQYGITDPVNPAAASNQVGIAGLLGQSPTSPSILGANPLQDERAQFNDRATFALGEFALQTNDNNKQNPQIDIRRSDQDRQIIKDPGNNDALDLVTPNADVHFEDVADPTFFPELPTVKAPRPDSDGVVVRNPPRFGRLDRLRKAATTTLLADQLSGYARRTGQTRFVIDGKVIDISGYRRR
jgi:hypothetical protein